MHRTHGLAGRQELHGLVALRQGIPESQRGRFGLQAVDGVLADAGQPAHLAERPVGQPDPITFLQGQRQTAVVNLG